MHILCLNVLYVAIFPKRHKVSELSSRWAEESQNKMQPKAGSRRANRPPGSGESIQRQQDEITQPSCLVFFTSNCSFPLLAGWPRNVSYIATSVSGSPTCFLPTVLSRNADFTKSLPQPASLEHGRGPLGKMASGLKKFQEKAQKQMLLLYVKKAYRG